MQIDTSDLRRLQREMQESLAYAPVEAQRIIDENAARVEMHQVMLVPVLSGDTQRSIDTEDGPDGLSAEIGPDTHYAPYVEHGTSRMAPQPFVEPALDRVKPQFLADCERLADPLGQTGRR